MERRYEIESLKRSMAMLQPGATAGLRREEALALIDDVEVLQGRLEGLRSELRRLAEEK